MTSKNHENFIYSLQTRSKNYSDPVYGNLARQIVCHQKITRTSFFRYKHTATTAVTQIRGQTRLTGGGDEGVDDDPVDKEEHQDNERPERLDEEQRQVDETLARLVEQRHDQHETRTHHEDHQQQDHLVWNGRTNTATVSPGEEQRN